MGSSPWLFMILMMMVAKHVFTTDTGQGCMREEDVLRYHSRFRVRNCLDVQNLWSNSSGVYTIYPYDCCPQRPVRVYCDMETDGGGWTVLQRRDDITPREKFNRIWMEYAVGFGNLKGEFWLGNDHIHALTDQTFTKIRFDMEDFENNRTYAEYKFFYVHSRDSSYKMEVDGYSGTAGNGFYYHSGTKFSTKDNDLDCWPRNCAEYYGGGWWFKSCRVTNPNGIYYRGGEYKGIDGITWGRWHSYQYSLKKMEIKIKPSY